MTIAAIIKLLLEGSEMYKINKFVRNDGITIPLDTFLVSLHSRNTVDILYNQFGQQVSGITWNHHTYTCSLIYTDIDMRG